MLPMINNDTNKIISFLILLVGTAATGLALGFSLAFTLSQLLKNQVDGWGGLVGALTGIALGYPLGIIVGQAIFRRKCHYPGSPIPGAIGAITGAWIPLGLAELVPLLLSPALIWPVFFLLPPLLATIGYSLKRRESRHLSKPG
jgi:hypothetical protein